MKPPRKRYINSKFKTPVWLICNTKLGSKLDTTRNKLCGRCNIIFHKRIDMINNKYHQIYKKTLCGTLRLFKLSR